MCSRLLSILVLFLLLSPCFLFILQLVSAHLTQFCALSLVTFVLNPIKEGGIVPRSSTVNNAGIRVKLNLHTGQKIRLD